jgi:drug/metabolite transporter (DMT)-like permease
MTAGFPLAVLALVFNAFVWGLSWYPFRIMQTEHLHPLWANALIFATGSLIVVLWKPRVVPQLWREPALWILALTSGATNAAFNWGISVGEVVRVVLLFYLMPLWTALLARVLLSEPLTMALGVRVALALTGAAIVLRPAGAALPLPQGPGDWLGILAGFTFALTSITLRRNAHLDGGARALAMLVGSMLVSSLTATVLSASGVIAWPPAPQASWLWLVAAMAIAFLLSNLSYQYGAARLPSSITSVVMITEVLFAAGSAIVLGNEAMTAALMVGGGLIVIAAVLAVRARPVVPARAPG